MGFVWYGEQAKAEVTSLIALRIEYAARWFRDQIKLKLSVPGTGRGGTLAGASAPGEYPRKQRGRLWASVQMRMERALLVAHVGTNLKYGKFLETGTSRMAARPWLSLAIAEFAEGIKSILAGRMAA